MKYMFLLIADESQPQPEMDSPEAFAEVMAPWEAYDRALREAGVFVGGEALMPSATARTMKRERGKVVVTDGPFVETKEHVAGFYIVDCADFDEAVKWAEKCPVSEHDKIEIRPLMELG